MSSATKRVVFNDPTRKFSEDPILLEEIVQLISNGPYLGGSILELFERDFAHYIGVEHCVGVSSGTAALEIAMRALDLQVGSQILLAANAGGYASIAAVRNGLVPNYYDVNLHGLADADSIASKIRPETKAIVITHLYGQMTEMESLINLAKKHEIFLIEDCAQAAGARRNGQLAGSLGQISTFSYYPTKNLATFGDAGAVCTSDANIAARLRSLREYGWSEKYFASDLGGGNLRMDNIHALTLTKLLPSLDKKNKIRRGIWQRYYEICSGSKLRLIGEDKESFVAHLAVLRINERNEFRASLESQGVATSIHYPFPDFDQPVFPPVSGADVPNTRLLCQTVVSIPLFPEMTEDEIVLVETALSLWVSRGK
jgi:dTDP-4-amino-4,6-dideoxygalactose transaminase